jgi:hypothetical protein
MTEIPLPPALWTLVVVNMYAGQDDFRTGSIHTLTRPFGPKKNMPYWFGDSKLVLIEKYGARPLMFFCFLRCLRLPPGRSKSSPVSIHGGHRQAPDQCDPNELVMRNNTQHQSREIQSQTPQEFGETYTSSYAWRRELRGESWQRSRRGRR